MGKHITVQLTEEQRAHLQGAARWTLWLLADRLVSLGLLGSITPAAVHGRLKKTSLSPGR